MLIPTMPPAQVEPEITKDSSFIKVDVDVDNIRSKEGESEIAKSSPALFFIGGGSTGPKPALHNLAAFVGGGSTGPKLK